MAIAIVIAVVLHMVVFDPRRAVEQDGVAPPAEMPVVIMPAEEDIPAVMPEITEAPAEVQPQKPAFAPMMTLETTTPLMQQEKNDTLPAWRRYAVPVATSPGRARVVVIIDDMGMDRKNTRAAMDLPGPLTLAFLPYAGELPAQTAYGRGKGHELMVHVPMEPVKGMQKGAPAMLRPGMGAEELRAVLEKDLAAFEGYVGINNHMGSKMTQDGPGMAAIMRVLSERGLLFVDSRTINSSVAADEAAKAGVPHAVRDVFLDHEETYAFAHDALEQVERKALKDGVAIAIGHPKPETIRALREWLPTLPGKGIDLVPVSAVMEKE